MRKPLKDSIRMPAVSGQFYPSDKNALREEIKSCFLSELGPGKMPGKSGAKKVLGAIVPHAGYKFSGPAAAFAYKETAESKKPDTYVVVGPGHMGCPSAISLKDWKTPLGTAKNDSEFGKALAENSGIDVNEEAHKPEHSIEVQIPFLQFVSSRFSFCPVIAGHDIDYTELAEAIRKTAKQLKKDIVVIASSDFTHYGPAYGYIPFKSDVKKNMHALDNGAIELIKKLDAGGFMDYADKKQATICGQIPIAVLIGAVKADAKKGKLMKYYTSGDVMGDYSNAVGYASIVFE